MAHASFNHSRNSRSDHFVRNFLLRICRWSLWRQSDSFYFTVSKSFGGFAVCKIETAFTVLFEAKSRSGRCPDFENSVASISLKTPQIVTGHNTIRCIRNRFTIFSRRDERESLPFKFLDASSLAVGSFSLCRSASVTRFRFMFF